MTTNSVTNLYPSPQVVKTPAFELSWDDIADGNFPPTRQQRMQQAAVTAAEQLQEKADLPVTQERLTKALDLVLTNAVTLHPNGTARVRSGSQAVAAATGPAPEAQAAPPPQVPPAETSESYCAIHQVQVEQRSNERGSWYSHIATDDEGEYFCKGKGRTRRNGR